MSIESLVTLAVVAVFFAYAALERWLPGYAYVRRPLWTLGGVLWFAGSFAVGSLVPLLTDEWLAAHALLDLSGWGPMGFVPLALTYQLLGYGWHRLMHGVPFLFRFHQLHHASERIDIWSAMRFHPLDIAGWTVLGSVSAILLLGVSLEAALLHVLFANAVAWLGHTNIRTPRWLGYLVARPEAHALHHARGHHRQNYADLPIIDMIFGTFENPREAPREAGFHDGASGRVGALLLGLDVSRATAPEAAARPSHPAAG